MRAPFCLCLVLCLSLYAEDFPKPFNSGTDVGLKPMPADEAVKLIKMPPGFKATVFAAEPDVQNPIACAWDSRGRLWIAENYTYADSKTNFDKTLRDRILIFEDTDNDGRHDKRTVFADNLQNLTSIELGYGGVYATAAPNLLFIPDKNGDDKPDGPAEVLLDGFAVGGVRHNLVNGIKWGPDGWLYGRHGILATSKVGVPGTPAAQRLSINVGIWRYHPMRQAVEMVTWGGTNPWGHDWTAEGEGFFTNTVTGHLYHIIPGAHYERMYGEDPTPHIYQLLPQTADHYHYDRSKNWTDSRDGKANDFGGGHAHIGCMIYLGDNWPAEYRGKLFTLNFHGRRINVNRLERKGCGYVGKSEPDMIFFGDPWFRGIELTYGPDGGVYVLDWSDQGECHENDGVHRESGRIYKITCGEVKPPAWLGKTTKDGDLAELPDIELIARAFESSEWEARTAKRLLLGRSSPELQAAIFEYLKQIARRVDRPNKRRLMQLSAAVDQSLSANPELAVESDANIAERLSNVGPAGRRTYASELTRRRTPVAMEIWQALLSHDEDASDTVLPHLYWSGFEPIVGGKDDSLALDACLVAFRGQIPMILEYTARRLAEDIATRPARVDGLLALATKSFDAGKGASITRGISTALRGVSKSTPPEHWPAFAAQTAQIPALADKIRELNVIFGDGKALDEIRAIALDSKGDIAARRQALESLINAKASELRATLVKLAKENEILPDALRGLAAFDDAAKIILARLPAVRAEQRPSVVGALCNTSAGSHALLDAIAAGKIPRADLTAYHARQIVTLAAAAKDAALAEKLTAIWGAIRSTPDDKKRRIASLKAALTPDVLAKADINKGREVYSKTCAACHTLYDLGQNGANLGPNLTGGGRDNLDYLLENMVDPNAVVPADFKLSVLTLKDGRVLSGFISAQNADTFTLRTMTDTQTLPRADVTKTDVIPQSLMPEGQLDALKPDEIRDLVGFLMKK